jgi:cytochrome c553
MPSNTLHSLSDNDVQAIVAFLRAQPAVDRVTPPTEVNLLGALLIGSNTFPTSVQPPITEPVPALPIGATPEYGRYATTIMGCTDCHGPSLTGGDPGGFAPAGPNLVSGPKRWTDAEFVRMFRTGTTPEGRALDPEAMPWPAYSAAFTDDELRAVYLYLRSL